MSGRYVEDHFDDISAASSEYGAPSSVGGSESLLDDGAESIISGGAGGGRRTPTGRQRGALDDDDDALDLLDLNNLTLNDVVAKQRNGAVAEQQHGPLDLLIDADEQEEEAPLPPHACAYCGIHNTSCVVKCLVCRKW